MTVNTILQSLPSDYLKDLISNLVNSLVPYLNSTVSCVAHILPDSKKRLQARAQNHKIGLFRRQIGEQNAVSFLRQLSVAHVEGQAKVFIFLSGLIISIKVIVSKFYGYITNKSRLAVGCYKKKFLARYWFWEQGIGNL